MHITLESDYATRIAYCLAKAPGRMDAKSISEETGGYPALSLKILRKLVASSIVKSFKGTQGGYELARDPKDISLCEIIETVEGRSSSTDVSERILFVPGKDKTLPVSMYFSGD